MLGRNLTWSELETHDGRNSNARFVEITLIKGGENLSGISENGGIRIVCEQWASQTTKTSMRSLKLRTPRSFGKISKYVPISPIPNTFYIGKMGSEDVLNYSLRS